MNIYQFRDLCASVLFMVLVACALPYVPVWIWIAATAAVVIVAAFMAYTIWWDGFAHRWTQKGDR